MTRRTLLMAALAGALHHLIPVPAKADLELITGNIRIVSAKTNEAEIIRYLENGRVRPEALIRLNQLFRYETGAQHEIDIRLIMLLDTIHTNLKAGENPFLLLSGYRPADTRRFSYHNVGMAADLQLEAVPLGALRNVATDLQSGGVGLYSQWVHVDVGPVRTWNCT